MKLLKYAQTPNERSESEMERHVQQLVLLATALATEVETLQAELARDNNQTTPIDLDNIDFYREVESYEIDLIRRALVQCGGNQSRAARLLGMKSTTLNAKMKHYGLNPVRPIVVQRTNAQVK